MFTFLLYHDSLILVLLLDPDNSNHHPYYHCDLEDCYNEQGKGRQIFKHLLSYSHRQSWLKQNKGITLNTREDIDSWFKQNAVNQKNFTRICDNKKWDDCSKSLLRGCQKPENKKVANSKHKTAKHEKKEQTSQNNIKSFNDNSKTLQSKEMKNLDENSLTKNSNDMATVTDTPLQRSLSASIKSPNAVDSAISRLRLESSGDYSSPTVNELLKDTDEEGNMSTIETNHKESSNKICDQPLDTLLPTESYIRSTALGIYF